MKKFSEILMLLLLIFAGIIFISAIISVFFKPDNTGLPYPLTGEKIGLVEIKGVILDSESTVRTISRYREDDNIKAILVRIDSPGGGVAASQEIYQALKRAREQGKIVVASMSSVAASGGYYIACAADTIVANPGTTTGSIGVILDFFDVSELLKKIGLRFNVIKSGKFKDTGNFDHPMTPQERAYLQRFVNDAFGQFVEVVASERGMPREQVLKLADGRVFTGRQAWKNGLIDVLGTYEDSVDLVARMAGISGKPHIVRPTKRRKTLFDLLFGDISGLYQSVQTRPVLRYQLVF
ncbi:MAG: signal peptide peptidase SppA [Calditrichaeota bacterium]|nr:MAG: signal peptide peptidase SppA [Calditrichota bacterium]